MDGTKERKFRFDPLIAVLALAVMVGGALSPQGALAATLYVSEFGSGVSQAGTTQAQIPPQADITDQTVALSASSAQSSAFNASTRSVSLTCDEGCSVAFGASGSASPVATTANYLLQQGVQYRFGVVPGSKVAVIANAAGNSGGATGTNVAITSPLNAQGNVKTSLYDSSGNPVVYNPNGQATMANSGPVAIASDQTCNTASAGACKAGNAAWSNTDTGSYLQGVRNDSGSTLAGTNLGYGPIRISGQGNVWTIPNGVYSATPPVLSDGVTNFLQEDVNGNLKVAVTSGTGSGATFTHIVAGQATTVVKSGVGTLYAIILNSKATATNVTTVYNNTAASGAVIGVLDAVGGNSDTSITYGPAGMAFTVGLTINTATANGGDMTVVWK